MNKYTIAAKKAWVTRRANGNIVPHNKKECPDIEKLRHLYIDEKLSSHKIAGYFGVSQKLILRWLRDYEIGVRSVAQAAKIANNGFKRNDKHPNWKGDDAGYQALHAWVRLRKGKPSVCEKCGTTDAKKYEWANISHEYKRDVDDWIRLCTSCHRYFDQS